MWKSKHSFWILYTGYKKINKQIVEPLASSIRSESKKLRNLFRTKWKIMIHNTFKTKQVSTMSRVKIVHVLNKRTKKDLIDTFKRIIVCPAAVNYNTNKLSTFNRRGLVWGFYFIIFISGIQFSRGIVLTTTPKPSEYASARRRRRGESCDSFVPSSFPVGNSTWRRPLHTPDTILALDVYMYIYMLLTIASLSRTRLETR